MAVCEIHLTAQNSLQKMTSVMALIPEKMEGPFPVLYLLHGLSDDHTAWTRRTSIERYVGGLPLIVVMPNGERSWYSDSKSNPSAAFETFITQDLTGFVDATFHTIPKREGRAIAGLSMGGYGAFKLALKHPDLFCAAASFSGALDMQGRIETQPPWQQEYKLIFGGNVGGTQDDVLALLEQADRSAMPALWMCCGDQDFLVGDNRRAHKYMESLGIPHHYREDAGCAHSWDYWDRVVQDALAFFKDQLTIPGQ